MKILIGLVLVFAPLSLVECEVRLCRNAAKVVVPHGDHEHELCWKHYRELVK